MLENIYTTSNFLEKSLDGVWIRNKVISNNIANVNTSQYKRKHVEFEDLLKQSISDSNFKMVTTNKRHINGLNNLEQISPKIVEDDNYSIRSDGNNVNIDTEMGNLAKNNVMYNALIRGISDEYEKIKNVINEGSR